MRTELIEDDDGAPYPPCRNCMDQVAPPGTGSNPINWAHVYADPEDGSKRWYLNNCQRPTVGRYGDPGNHAEPDMDKADEVGTEET